MYVKGWKNFSKGSMEASLERDFVQWVEKASVVVLGRGGWISKVCRELVAVEGEVVGGLAAVGDGEGASAGILEGGEEGISGGGLLVLGGEYEGAVAGGRASTGGSSGGGEEEICSRGRFAGGEARCVGEGELESYGRLWYGGLEISSSPEE